LNVNVADGLENGAGGVLQKIHLTSHDNSAAGVIWMKFDDASVGKQTRIDCQVLYKSDIDASWTPIQPLSRQFQVGRGQSSQVIRKQFPVRQSAAKTIHKCQGDTLDQVVVDLTSKRKEPHSHYVALSRVKTLSGLFILSLNTEKVHVREYVKCEMAELCSTRNLTLAVHQPFTQDKKGFDMGFQRVFYLVPRSKP